MNSKIGQKSGWKPKSGLEAQNGPKRTSKFEVFSRETEVHLEFPHEKTKGTCQFDRENTVPSERQMGGRGDGPLEFSRETEVHLGFSHEKTKGEYQLDRENTVPSERR